MKIELNKEEYEELKDLIEIFDSVFFDGKEVFAFEKIKEFVDKGTDINEVEEAVRKEIKWQLEEGFDWIESFHIWQVEDCEKVTRKEIVQGQSTLLWTIGCKEKLLSYF